MFWRKIGLAFVGLFLFTGLANAQCTGVFNALSICGNPGAGAAFPSQYSFETFSSSVLYAVKNTVRVATTANITLSGAQTIDGVSVIAGDRVLVKNQSTASQNGIYVAASGAWSRSTDANTTGQLSQGTRIGVTQGTVGANQTFYITTANPITIGSTSITFALVPPATVTGAIKSNGAGAFSQAACGDLTNGATSCSTDTTNASNITSGTLGGGRMSPVNLASSANGGVTGNLPLNQVNDCELLPGGRLTLSTGVPVMTSTVSGATTVYYTPYKGQVVPIYDGSRFACINVGGELSQATTDATKSPAAVAASSCYDVFVWLDGSTPRATRGPAWTNATTRSAGTALSRVNGILTNNAAITNGPSQNLGTYVGSICSNGSSTIDYIFGASASGGTAGSHNVWNMYNRVRTVSTVIDSGIAYTYTSSTVRQARASAGNQITIVVGLNEESVDVAYNVVGKMVTVNNAGLQAGIGLDSTSAYAACNGQLFQMTGLTTVALQNSATTACSVYPGLGQHFFSALENSDGTNANTFDQGSKNSFSAVFFN